MSSLIVEVTTISKIRPHDNADKLEIAEILGWQICVSKGQFAEGDKVVYFPPDTVLPRYVSDGMNVTNFLGKASESRLNGRIKQVRLRGEPSFGLVVPLLDLEWELGQDVAECYGATKYEPPLRVGAGDTEANHPLFITYTDIENLRNHPDVFTEGEEVVITEKIHGTNCRIGIVPDEIGFKIVAGSHGMQRKKPENEDYKSHLYWYPASIEGVVDLFNYLKASMGYQQIILFGETYGSRVQKGFAYDKTNELGFRAFDIYADGQYLDYISIESLFDNFDIPQVPLLHRGSFSMDKMRALSGGQTCLWGQHMREGIVIKPVMERRDPKIGRAILKYVNDDYLLSKHSDFKDE